MPEISDADVAAALAVIKRSRVTITQSDAPAIPAFLSDPTESARQSAQLGFFRQAARTIAAVLEENKNHPHVPDWHRLYAHWLYRAGDYEASIPAWLICAEETGNESKRAAIYASLAASYIGTGELIKARVYATKSWGLHNNPVASWNLCIANLVDEDFEQGYPLFAVRAVTRHPAVYGAGGNNYDLPLWQGERCDDKPLLVLHEQGLGEQILYASLLREAPAIAGKIILGVSPRLMPMMRRSFPEIEMLENGKKIPPVAALAHMGDFLPMLRPNIDAWPKHEGYLTSDPTKTETLCQALEAAGGKGPIIGLSWRSTNGEIGNRKSLRLKELAPIMAAWPEATFVSLQYDESVDDEVPGLPAQLVRLSHVNLRNDIETAAALVGACDLVITVSNINAHLAGALGVPCWMLLGGNFGRIWYWFEHRVGSPWYPSMRIFRQKYREGWAAVVEQAAAELAGLKHVGSEPE